MSKRGHSAMAASADPLANPAAALSARPAAAAHASTAASAAAAAVDPSKRVKLEDLVREGLGVPAAAKSSSMGGIVLGELPQEHKSVDLYASEDDGGDEMQPRQLTEQEEMDAILRLVDNAPVVAELDAASARALVTRFAKAVSKNTELRARFPDDPLKYMDSEVALDEALTALAAISSRPSFFGLLLEPASSGESCMESLCTLLLSHENIDVAASSLKLLAELVDAEEVADVEGAEEFIEYVVGDKSSFMQCVVRSLARWPVEVSKSDADSIGFCLAILENLTDLSPKVAERLVRDTGIVEWIVKRLQDASFNQNKLYASEILSILLTSSGTLGQEQLGAKVADGQGIRLLVRCIAKYRKEDPANDEEAEFVENLFDVLCLALHNHAENQKRFSANDGLQLMLTMIRRQTYAKSAAWKLIDFACQQCALNCEQLIDFGGLKTVFAALMANPVTKKERADQTANELHLLEIIAQLFLNVADVRYLRLRQKFIESELVKSERTVELMTKYQARVDDAEKAHAAGKAAASASAAAAAASSASAADALDVESYSRRLDHGLAHVELASIILAFLATSGERTLHARIEQLLNQQDLSFTDLQKTIRMHTRMIDAGDETNAAAAAPARNKAVLDALAGMLAE